MPTIATSRSVYTKAADLSARQPDDLVNFYGEQPHGVRLHLPTAKVIYFPRQQRDEFVRFVASHQSLIVVASDEDFYATRQAIAETHELLPTGDHEHLYLARRITDVASKRDPKEGILR